MADDGSDLTPPQRAMLLVQGAISNRLDSVAEIRFGPDDILHLGFMCAGLVARCAKAEGTTTEAFMQDLGLRAAVLAGRAERKP